MEDDRITAARSRIETALARIERGVEATQSEGKVLAKKHDALRESVSASIARLDDMIGKLES